MALVLNCWEVATTADVAESVTVTKPTSSSASGDAPKNAAAGDLLIILVGNDDNSDTAQWDDATLKPTGFTLINEVGNATEDCHCAAFYKIVVGTEDATFQIPAQSSDDLWAACILVSGYKPVLHKTGADTVDSTPAPLSITEVTTTTPQTLCFFVAAYDGGDDGGYTTGGTGWVERAEIRNGTGSGNASGVWGTKVLAAAGASVAATVTPASADGMVGFQFAISETPTVIPKFARIKALARKFGLGIATVDAYADADDEWTNTVDDIWYGVASGNIEVTVKVARLKLLAYKKGIIRSLALFAKVAKVKLRQAKPKAILTRVMGITTKFARIKTGQGKPKAILTRIYTLTAKFVGIKLGTERVDRPVFSIPATVKFVGSKLRASKVARPIYFIPTVVKFAGVKIGATISTLTALSLDFVTVVNAGIKLVATRGSLILRIVMNVKRAGTKIRALKLTRWLDAITLTVKRAGMKLRVTRDRLTLRIVQAVKTSGVKLGARKSALSLQISMKVKRAGVKLRSLKDRLILRQKAFVRTAGVKLRATRSAVSGLVSLVTKVVRTKIGATRDSLTLRIAVTAKRVGVKLRALKSSIWFVVDLFKDTVDDFWVSTLDDEWLGHFILRIKNARFKLRAHKDRLSLAIPVILKRAGIKLRFRRSIVGAYYAALELAVKNARLKLRARKATLSAYMATIALTLKNAGTKIRATKPVLDFHFLWTTVKNAGVKFQIERFTGWYVSIPLINAGIKILAKKNQFSFRLAVRNARVKLRARKVLLVRRVTITARTAGMKLRAQKDALILRLVMAVKRARIKMSVRRNILTRVVRITLKNAGLKIRATKNIITFSFATITLFLKNVGVKMRPTLSTVQLYEATISLVLKNAGTKIRSGISTLRFSWMTPLTVKMVGLKIRSLKSDTMARFFTLTVQAARLKIGASKGQLVRVVTVATKTAGVKIRSQISHLITSFITLTVVATGLKIGATRSITSSIHTLGTKIARFKVGATKRTLSSGTILWRGIIKFMTRALSYRFSASGDAVKFDTRAEVYRFVSKND